MDGNLLIEIKSEVEDELRNALAGLKPEEAAVLAMLRSRLAMSLLALRPRQKATAPSARRLMPLSSKPVFTDR
jgi:hypothetical protein